METLTVKNTEPANPSLEETAAKMGIDPNAIDSTATEQAAPEGRPSWLPEGFNTPEDFAKAFAEMKAKETPAERTEPETAADAATETETETEETPAETTERPGEAEAREAATKSGLDLEALSASYWEQGDLTDTQYEALEKGGYPKGLVKQFIEGQTAVLNAERTSVFNEVGGEESYKGMLDWARTNLTPAEIVTYDKAVNGKDASARMAAVKGLQARAQVATGFEPTRTVEGNVKATVDSYSSIAEMQADMRDKRYANDPAFRRKVESKLERSDIF